VVVTIDSLKLATGRPRESILRDLKGIGYYSSYNARGKFYTLASTPVFDDLGLWKCRGAYFSIRRTLLDTAEHLVNVSDAGRTHDELRRILGIGIQNSLHQLAMAGKIARRQVGAQYIYFGIGAVGDQMERRSAMPVEPAVRKMVKTPDTKCHPDMDPVLVIDILIAVLRGHATDSAAHSYLRRTGSPVTERQVATVFRHYGIGKKNSPAQK
jgi:hypothetical protein